MGRGQRQDQALSAAPSRTQHHGADPNSFDGVAAALSDLYDPLQGYNNGNQLSYAINEGTAPTDLQQRVTTMVANMEAIETALVPSLPRAAALRASLLGQDFEKQSRSLYSEAHGVVHPRGWHGSICRSFLDMQASYQEMVALVSAYDPALHEENRKRERAEAKAARISEERAAFDRRQRFQDTAKAISGH